MRNTSDIFPDEDSLQKQSGILDSLQASLDSLKNNTKNDKQMEEKVFSVVLTELSDAVVYDRIKNMFKATSHQSHSCSHLKLSEVYEVDITTMRERFEQYGKPIGNIRQYWHGTRVANVLSILHKGLIIPPSSASHVCGRMFGDGLYFSDQSTKSLNYSYGYWDGRSKDNNCFMFLADVAMGKQYTPTNTYERLPRTGFDSTFAQAGKSGVNNNEMIVYNVNQCNLRYLCKFA
jgi:poly [ADP-ribose] polymerase